MLEYMKRPCDIVLVAQLTTKNAKLQVKEHFYVARG